MSFQGPQIYVLRNIDLPFSKIGFTRRTAEQRAKEYTRGDKWIVEKYWPIKETYFVPRKKETTHIDAGKINIEAVEYYILELFSDFRIPHVDTVTLPVSEQSWLEIFAIYPSVVVYILDRFLFDLYIVDTNVDEIERLKWPNNPEALEYLEEFWEACRMRMEEIHTKS